MFLGGITSKWEAGLPSRCSYSRTETSDGRIWYFGLFKDMYSDGEIKWGVERRTTACEKACPLLERSI